MGDEQILKIESDRELKRDDKQVITNHNTLCKLWHLSLLLRFCIFYKNGKIRLLFDFYLNYEFLS